MRALLVTISIGVLLALSAPGGALAQQPTTLTSIIGDFDCFGYGVPSPITSPCGTLPGPPVADPEDPPLTDVTLGCPPNTTTITHTFTLPPGATVVLAIAVIGLGGIETSKYGSTLTADGIPIPLSNLGQFGTTVIAIPFFPPLTVLFQDDKFVWRLTHGRTLPAPAKCDDVFVDFAAVFVVHN